MSTHQPPSCGHGQGRKEVKTVMICMGLPRQGKGDILGLGPIGGKFSTWSWGSL